MHVMGMIMVVVMIALKLHKVCTKHAQYHFPAEGMYWIVS